MRVRSEASAVSTAARVALWRGVLGVWGQSGVMGGGVLMLTLTLTLLGKDWRLGMKGRAGMVRLVGGVAIGVVGEGDK